MRRLSNSVTVKAPTSFALAYIHTYFLERGPQGGAKLALRFPLPDLLIDGLTIEKSVSLKLEHVAAEAGTTSMAIGWQPIGTRALPSFSGTLAAVPQSESICSLSIEGGYEPPGGIMGTLFDTLIGVRIGRATLAALLTQLAQEIEADYSARMIL